MTASPNMEAEQVILATCLKDNRAYEDIADRLRPEHFGNPLHAQAWDAIGKLIVQGKRAEVATIIPHLNKEAPGGHSREEYLSKKIRFGVRPRDELPGFTDAIIDAANALKISAICKEYGQRAQDGEAGLAEKFAAEVTEMQCGAPAETYRSIKDSVTEVIERIKEKHRTSPGAITGISTGFPILDDMIDGLCQAKLIVIGARPKQGKTALVGSIALHVAKQGHPVAFFSLEMPRDELIKRMISMESGVNSKSLSRASYLEHEESGIEAAGKVISQLPIIIDDASNLSASALTMRARRAVKRDGCKLIIIDYLQYMTAERKGSRYEGVTAISMAIAGLRKTLNVPIIALAQLNRKSLDRTKFDFSKFNPEMTRANDGDIRDSGQIEQDADTLIFINRPLPILQTSQPIEGEGNDFEERKIKWLEACAKWRKRAEERILVHMNRSGPTGIIQFLFDENTYAWTESPIQEFHSGGMKFPLNFVSENKEEDVHAAEKDLVAAGEAVPHG